MGLLDSLHSYWTFDEVSGDAVDAHSTFDLEETGGIVGSAAGILGNSRDLEADDTEELRAGQTNTFNPGDSDFTWTFWVKFETVGTTQVVMGKATAVASNVSYIVFLDVDNFLKFRVSSTGSDFTTVTNGISISTATWYFVAVIHDSANNEITIRVNDNVSALPHSAGIFANIAIRFRIGASSGGNNFDGLIDEMGYWTRCLTPSELNQLYNSGAAFAYPFLVDQVVSIGQASSTESAGSFVAIKGKVVVAAQAMETATAVTPIIDRAFPVETVTEADIADAIPSAKLTAFTRADETDSAAAVPRVHQTVAITTATETGTPASLAAVRTYAVTLASETDTADVVQSGRSYAVGRPDETDSVPTTLTRIKSLLVGQVIEIDSPGFFGSQSVLAFTRADETDSAHPISTQKTLAITSASETDTADTLGTQKSIELATIGETDAAGELQPQGTRTLNRADETDSAETVVAVRIHAAGQAAETDTAAAVAISRDLMLAVAPETDTAVTIQAGRTYPVAQADEADSAVMLGMPLIKLVGRADETDAAGALDGGYALVIGAAVEADLAESVLPGRTHTFTGASETDTASMLILDRAIAVARPDETDSAATLPFSFGFVINPAIETNSADMLGSWKTLAVGAATETDAAQAVVFSENIPIGLATEGDSALDILPARSYAVDRADETDVSATVIPSRSFVIGPASDTETAAPILVLKSVLVGVAIEADTAFAFIVIGGKILGIDFYSSNVDARPTVPLCLLRGRMERLRFEFLEQLGGGILTGTPTIQELVNGRPANNGDAGTRILIEDPRRNGVSYTTAYGLGVMMDQAVFAEVTINGNSRGEKVLLRVTCGTNSPDRNVVQDFEIITRG